MMWILSYTAATLGTWTWDVVMDWGLWPGHKQVRLPYGYACLRMIPEG